MSDLAERMMAETELGKEHITINIPFRSDILLEILGLSTKWNRRELVGIRLTEDRSIFCLRGRFPIWAQDGDDIDYTFDHEIDATLFPSMEYANDLQMAIVTAQREVDRKWAEKRKTRMVAGRARRKNRNR